MNFQIKRVSSSNSKPKDSPSHRWRHTNKIPSAKLTLAESSNFYFSESSTMAYSSVEFKTRTRTKNTLRSILMSSSSMFDSSKITSRSWCIFDSLKNKYFGFRQKNQREIASLTKIMTTILAIQFSENIGLNPQLYVKVTEASAKMIGTTAGLKPRTWIKYRDLLYGAMLPSGNDAAYLLSQIVGYLYRSLNSNMQYLRNLKFLDISKENTNMFTVDFIKLMNKKAEQLGMTLTQFSNPHGLQNAMNISCPKDVIILSNYACQNSMFRRIMNAQNHKYEYIELIVQNPDQAAQGNAIESPKKQKQSIKINRCFWQNTNILLKKGWEGVKTGQTGPAGSCLSSLRNGIFIVVLNCKDNQTRFTDTQRIYSWYMGTKKNESTDDQQSNLIQTK